MKKLLIGIILALTLAFPALADGNIALEDTVDSLCWQGETLYLLGSETIYSLEAGSVRPICALEGAERLRWRGEAPEDEAEAALWRQAVSFIVPGKTAPLAVQAYSGDLYRVENGGLSFLGTLPAEGRTFELDGTTVTRRVDAAAGADDVLWLMLEADWEDWQSRTVLRYDVSTGETTSFTVKNVNALAAASDGCLLATGYTDAGEAVCRLLDGLTGETLRELPGSDGTVAWSADGVVAFEGGRLNRVAADGTRTPCGYAPDASLPRMGISTGGVCAICDGQRLFLRDLNHPAEPTVLRVAGLGWLSTDDVARFSLENPDIALVSAGESVQQAALSRGADLFAVEAPGLYASLVDRRGLLPLSDETLAAKAEGFYEAFREVIAPDGELLAWPVQVTLDAWSLDETVWEACGLGDEPAVYADVMKLLAVWRDEHQEDWPGYKLAELPYSLAECVQQLTRRYILACGDVYPDFTADGFREAVATVAASAELIDENAWNEGMPVIYSYPIGFGMASIDGDTVRMMRVPAATAESAPCLPASMTLLTVSSATDKADAALRLIRWYADNMNATLRCQLDPSANEPVRSATYEATRDDLAAQRAAVTVALVEAEDKTELQEQLNQLDRRIAANEEEAWKLSPASIANYREIASNLVVPWRSPLLTNEGGMAALDERIQRACDSGLDGANLDRLLRELTEVAASIMKESE